MLWFQVQGMTRVFADVLIGKDLTALSHHKPFEWPVALSDLKFATTRIVKFFQASDSALY